MAFNLGWAFFSCNSNSRNIATFVATSHGFGIGLTQVGSGQIHGHHELQFEAAPEVVQEGEVTLEAKAIHGQLSGQGSDVASA